MNIVLVGNPNIVKTTIYNALTGKIEKIGNWAGVTVDIKKSKLKDKYNTFDEEVTLFDLPGTYTLESYTKDEHVATSFIKHQKIDLIINVVDAVNLERSLYFTTQLIDMEIPVIVALNKIDISSKKKMNIDIKKLETLLNCKVVPTKAISKQGLLEIVEEASKLISRKGVKDE